MSRGDASRRPSHGERFSLDPFGAFFHLRGIELELHHIHPLACREAWPSGWPYPWVGVSVHQIVNANATRRAAAASAAQPVWLKQSTRRSPGWAVLHFQSFHGVLLSVLVPNSLPEHALPQTEGYAPVCPDPIHHIRRQLSGVVLLEKPL
jgi:hypothetical protein